MPRLRAGRERALVRADPQVYTTTFAKRGRERKILLDLRTNRTNTSAGAFSPRARPVRRCPCRWSGENCSCKK
jgi:DNA primase